METPETRGFFFAFGKKKLRRNQCEKV